MEKVDEVFQEQEENAAEIDEIHNIIARGTGDNIADEDFDEEMAMLEAEMQFVEGVEEQAPGMAVPGAPLPQTIFDGMPAAPAAMPMVPTSAPVASKPAAVSDEDAALAALEAEMA